MHPRLRAAGVVAAAVALAGAAGPATAAPPSPAAAPPSPAAAAAVPAAPAAGRTVTLVTGDTVRVRGGAVTVTARDRRGAAGSVRTVRTATGVSVLPAVALPYLGRQLDPRLFDVTALAAAPAGRLPVTVTYRPGAAHRSLPGVTLAPTSGDTAAGYLTATSARRFGEALAADARAGGFRSGGLFTGVAAVRYGGAVAPVVQPRYPMVTLRIPVLDATGAPAPFGTVALVNTDDARRYQAFSFVEDGEVRVSVPTGHYGLLAEVPSFGADGTYVDRLVNVSDVTVGAATTLAPVDARTARVRVGVTTPRPATADVTSVEWLRGTAEGYVSSGYSYSPGADLLVAPGAPAVHGRLRWTNSWRLTGPGGAYSYDLLWAGEGAVPTRQRFTATAGVLATLRTGYHADVPDRTIHSARFAFLPGDDLAFSVELPVAAPRTRPEYVGGDQRVTWSQFLTGVEYFTEDEFVIADVWTDGGRRYPAGQTVRVSWARQPEHPSIEQSTGAFPFPCPACRSGDTLGVRVSPRADSEPDHVGFLDQYGETGLGTITASTRLRVWQGGTLRSDERDVTGTRLTGPAGRAHYRVRYEQQRAAPWIRLGTAATTEWGFDSARPAARTVPADWSCPTDEPCAALPLLVPTYQVPVDLRGRVAAGPGPVTVGFTPTQGAPVSPVVAASLRWSADDGATWAAVPVRALGGGRYAATVPNPAGATVSLRVTAADRAGDTVTQTLVRAYAVR